MSQRRAKNTAKKTVRVVASKKTRATRKRNPTKLFRVVALSGSNVLYLNTSRDSLETDSKRAEGWNTELMARHMAEHMALRFPDYKWGIERP